MHPKANLILERLKNNHFINHMGLNATLIETGLCELQINVLEHHQQHHGFLHGGVTATLADVATGIAAYTVVPDEKNVVTADLKISYLNPSTSNRVKAIGKVTKAGKFLVFCECQIFDVFDNENKLIATATAIMASIDIPTK